MTRSDKNFRTPAWPFTRGAAVACILIGGQVLLGWALGVDVLKSLLPGLVTMKANTAVGFVLGGLALLRPTRRWGAACGAGVAALGLLTLAEYFLGVDLGIDQWLFREPPGAIGTPFPNRMAPTTALCFALLGAALVLANTGRGLVAAQSLALAAATVAVTALVGYLYAVDSLSWLAYYTHSQIALNTVSAILVLRWACSLISRTRARWPWSRAIRPEA